MRAESLSRFGERSAASPLNPFDPLFPVPLRDEDWPVRAELVGLAGLPLEFRAFVTLGPVRTVSASLAACVCAARVGCGRFCSPNDTGLVACTLRSSMAVFRAASVRSSSSELTLPEDFVREEVGGLVFFWRNGDLSGIGGGDCAGGGEEGLGKRTICCGLVNGTLSIGGLGTGFNFEPVGIPYGPGAGGGDLAGGGDAGVGLPMDSRLRIESGILESALNTLTKDPDGVTF